MKTTVNALRLETVAAAKSADMISGRDTTLMTSVAQDVLVARSGRADMLSGENTCLMTSVADR